MIIFFFHYIVLSQDAFSYVSRNVRVSLFISVTLRTNGDYLVTILVMAIGLWENVLIFVMFAHGEA